MARRISYHPDFFRDLEEIYEFIAADSPVAARDVALAFANCLDEIERTPEIGPLLYGSASLNQSGFRQKAVLPYHKYSILYRLSEVELHILYAHHAGRNLEQRLSEENRRSEIGGIKESNFGQ